MSAPSMAEMRRPRWARALAVGTRVEVQIPQAHGAEAVWRPGVVVRALPRGVLCAVDETTVEAMAAYLVRRAA